MENLKTKGVKRRLRGFKLSERGIPRTGYEIVNAAGENIGTVTSGTMSPILKQGIGLGYINVKDAAFGSEIFIKVRQRQLKAEVVKLPFV